VTSHAPPRRGGLADIGRTVGRAAAGGTIAFVSVVAVGQILAMVGLLLIGAYGVWSWAKVGLLTVLLSLRADAIVAIGDGPFLPPTESRTLQVRFVPMLLTIAFLWLASRAGRRAARTDHARQALAAAGLAAAGAGVPVAILAVMGSALVTLSFPSLGLRVRVDPGSAALWAGVLAAVGAGTGAYLEAGRGRASAAALRGGLIAYGWALGLAAGGVLVVATLEPIVTRGYVDGMLGLGTGGSLLLGYHVLAIPAQSALLLAPAAGSCLEIVGEGVYQLCPWRLVGPDPVAALLLPEPLALSPGFWLLNVVPFVGALLGGRRAGHGADVRGRAIGRGVAAGWLWAGLVLVGAWFVAPRWFASPTVFPDFLPLSDIAVRPAWGRTAIAALLWGTVGGGLGAWLAMRYDEPGLPSPTSA
jgi:hypothetical protein